MATYYLGKAMAEEQPAYLSYLVRLWREGKGEVWRASAQHPHTGERIGFASLEDLFDYLRREMGAAPDADADAKRAECETQEPPS